MGGWQGFAPWWQGHNWNWPGFSQGGFGQNWGTGFGFMPWQYGQFGYPWGQVFNAGYGTFPFAGYGFGQSSYGGPMNDQEIKYFVENAIDNDATIPSNAMINVDVHGGVVTLTGTVPNKRIKHAAGDDAWFITQVTDVNNEINVTPRRERAAPGMTEGASGGRRGTTANR
jgi:hypothetical protein